MTCHDDSSAADERGEAVTPSPGQEDKSVRLPDAAPTSADVGAAPELREAFGVLAQAVQNLLERNKQPRAAGVKSEMQRIISGVFDQSTYGYGTFRDFVEDAESNGAVVVVGQSAKGVDALITLPGQTIPSPSSTPLRRRRRIRPDVWRAFTSWEPGHTRVWDLEDDQVLMFPAEPRPLEPSQHRVWRDEVAAHPERFRTIQVITEGQLLTEMRSFVDSLDPESDSIPILRAALEQNRPARSFTVVARALPGIAEGWKQDRFDFVWSSIEQWQESNGVQFSIEDASPRSESRRAAKRANPPIVTTGHAPTRPGGERSDAAANATRERILAALARMPLSELLRLRVPVEYLIDQ